MPDLPAVRVEGSPRGDAALAVARVGRWLALVRQRRIVVGRAPGPGPLIPVAWRDATGDKGVLWATRDGRFATANPARLSEAIARLEGDRARARCLAARGVRVLLDPASPQSAVQRRAIGHYAAKVVITCAPARDRACTGKTLPRWLAPGGATAGVLTREALAARWGCR